MDTPSPTIPDVLRSAPESLLCHLSVIDPASLESITLAALTEASFPGYAPKKADHWSALQRGVSPLDVSREMSAVFTCSDAGAEQLIRGWYLTTPLPDDALGLVAAGSVTPPNNMNAAGKVCALRVHVTTIPEEDATGLRLLVSSTALAFFGGINDMAQKGEDRRCLMELKKAIERVARRDAAIPSLSTRSKRSRLPVIPGENTALVAAIGLVQARVNTLLTS